MSGDKTMTAKVLIVDDQEPMRALLAEILETIGCEPCTAVDGEDGIRQLHELQPDLVITDLRMPTMDGYEFCRIAKMVCEAPIMMLTSMGPGQYADREPNLIDDYVMKPVSIDELKFRVRRLLMKNAGDTASPA